MLEKNIKYYCILSKKIFFTTLCSLLQLTSLKSRHSFHSNGKFGKPKTSPFSILKWNPPISLRNRDSFWVNLDVVYPFTPEEFPIDELNHLVLVKSISGTYGSERVIYSESYNLNCWHSDINKIIMMSIVQTFWLSWLSRILMKLIPKNKSYAKAY